VHAAAITAPTLLRHSAELLRLLLKSPQPSRSLVSEYLHARKKLTTEGRGAISSVVFHTLRHLHLAYYVATGDRFLETTFDTSTAAQCTTAAVVLDSIPELQSTPVLTPDLHGMVEELTHLSGLSAPIIRERGERLHSLALAANFPSGLTDAALLYSMPQWVMQCWSEQQHRVGYPSPRLLAASLLSPAPLTLRVNTRVIGADSLRQELLRSGIAARVHPLLPSALRLDARVQLTGTAWERSGMVEIQDAGSQLIAAALAPVPGSHVLDACAGAGGKTMHLSDLYGDSVSITASDIERTKLLALRRRAERTGACSIETVHVPSGGDLSTSFASARFDAIIVDAPCSGFGTARRNPSVKWKTRQKSVKRLADRQYDILCRNAALLKPGGVLVYATCSLLPDENDHVIERFLDTDREFHGASLAEAFSASGITLPSLQNGQFTLTLCPDLLDSDGYFIARLRKYS
jgi:16S rRNA (cytosine(967)-C(5))-methyltransferase